MDRVGQGAEQALGMRLAADGDSLAAGAGDPVGVDAGDGVGGLREALSLPHRQRESLPC